MPKVIGPFFSAWASGSFGKVLTCYWHGQNNKFTINKMKSRSGKRHPIQILNSEIFAERNRAIKVAKDTEV